MKKYSILKKITASVCAGILLLSFSTPISAATYNNSKVVTTVIITDPETGGTWKWTVPESELSVSTTKVPDLKASYQKSSSDSIDKQVTNTSVTVNVGEYLNKTISAVASLGQSTTEYDNINITTGLTYIVNTSLKTVSLLTVFGSNTQSASYYAGERVVYWRNPAPNIYGKFYPTSTSWEFSVKSTPGRYSAQLPPYSILDCNIHIPGMSAYKKVSVICELKL